MSMPPVFDSILGAIGNTPMVRLTRLERDLRCELLGKCEFLNPGGSVKDRIGVRMVEDAEREGRIKPGDTLIEPTSGNTGIGIALAGVLKGYRVIVTMPEKMSHEKQVILEALGAEIIRTPTEAAWDAPESHISVARRLQEIIPNAHVLDQYNNPSNPLAHAEGTGREIVEQCGGKLDAVVVSAGTGGSITGIAQTIRREIPGCQIIGVDPVGSILAGPGEIHSYKVEGIGYDFIPKVLDRSLVDRWVKTTDAESFHVARRLIRHEGLLVGGSSGAAAWAALQVCKEMRPGQRVVVVLPDSVRNYMTKFVDDSWMRRNGFADTGLGDQSVGDLVRALPERPIQSVPVDASLTNVVGLFKEKGISQVPVFDAGRLAGILTESDVLQFLVQGRAKPETTVAEVMVRTVSTVTMGTNASELTAIFERGEVALVVDTSQRVVSILTKIDLIELLAGRQRAAYQM
jgi:cystathionine beta-synthase